MTAPYEPGQKVTAKLTIHHCPGCDSADFTFERPDDGNSETHGLFRCANATHRTERLVIRRYTLMDDEFAARRDELAALADPDCERCEGSGLDPDEFTTRKYAEGRTVHYLTEPCRDCIGDDDDLAKAGAR